MLGLHIIVLGQAHYYCRKKGRRSWGERRRKEEERREGKGAQRMAPTIVDYKTGIGIDMRVGT